MKSTNRLAVTFILVISTIALMGWHSLERPSDMDTKQIVILQFKAQEDKGDQTVSELTDLIEKVSKEPHFVSIRLHVDPMDNTNILLYEEWGDMNYYKTQHMETDHMQAFMKKAEAFLAGPPDIAFWEEKRVFN